MIWLDIAREKARAASKDYTNKNVPIPKDIMYHGKYAGFMLGFIAGLEYVNGQVKLHHTVSVEEGLSDDSGQLSLFDEDQ